MSDVIQFEAEREMIYSKTPTYMSAERILTMKTRYHTMDSLLLLLSYFRHCSQNPYTTTPSRSMALLWVSSDALLT